MTTGVAGQEHCTIAEMDKNIVSFLIIQLSN